MEDVKFGSIISDTNTGTDVVDSYLVYLKRNKLIDGSSKIS